MIAMECNGKDVYENSCCVLQCILNVKVLRGCDFCVICEVFFSEVSCQKHKKKCCTEGSMTFALNK